MRFPCSGFAFLALLNSAEDLDGEIETTLTRKSFGRARCTTGGSSFVKKTADRYCEPSVPSDAWSRRFDCVRSERAIKPDTTDESLGKGHDRF